MGCNLMHLISKPGYLYFSMPEVVLLPGKRKVRLFGYSCHFFLSIRAKIAKNKTISIP